jgi:multicomponent K+:H+ antiporter subunit A
MRDILLSACVGGVVTLLMWIVTFSALFPSISPYFLMESIAQAGGHNVVNVIIVDFRGFDTLGEITVVAVAAIALFSVHKLSKKEDEIC